MAALCLAQAQEMVVQKAVKDNMKDNIVAKLAGHADDLFAEVVEVSPAHSLPLQVMKVMQKEAVRGLWDKDWLPLVSGKQALYNGLSQFHQSKVGSAPALLLGLTPIIPPTPTATPTSAPIWLMLCAAVTEY